VKPCVGDGEDVKKPSDCMPQMLGFETVSAHG
jgi:hypothetical protein